MSKLVGISFDGCSNMSGLSKGIQAKIGKKYPIVILHILCFALFKPCPGEGLQTGYNSNVIWILDRSFFLLPQKLIH